jgi:hypothetical protein
MHTVKIYARGVSRPVSMSTDIEEQMEAYFPDAYAISVLMAPDQLGDYDVVIQVEGLVTQADKKGSMDLLFEDILQVVVNFHADGGGRFTLIENISEDVGIILFQQNVVCTCGDGALEAAEKILREGH